MVERGAHLETPHAPKCHQNIIKIRIFNHFQSFNANTTEITITTTTTTITTPTTTTTTATT